MTFCWGIVGVGQISHDFCTALAATGFQSTTHKHIVIAIGSRSLERSKEFAKRHKIQRCYGSYDDVAKDSDVEIVYIANLNNLHFETCMSILKLGKHILCEKPFSMNYHESKQIIEMAKQQNRFIMEGIWSRFFPVYAHLRRLFANDSDLCVNEVIIKHGFKGDTVDRVTKKELGGGIVLDIGVYAIQFVLMVFKGAAPKSIVVKNCKVTDDGGVDMFFEADLKYNDDIVANIVCSGLEELENKAIIVTNKGSIIIPTYWCPTEIIGYDGVMEKFPIPKLNRKSSVNFTNSLGLRYEADAVQKCIRSAELFCDLMPPTETLLIAKIQDEIRKQINEF